MNIVKNKRSIVFFHFLVWIILFSLPYLLSSGQSEALQKVLVHSWIPLCFYALIFYGNYFILIDKFLFREKILLFVVLNVIMVAVFVLVNNEIKTFLVDQLIRPEIKGQGPPKKLFIYVDIISFSVPVVFSIALKTTQKWIKTEALQKEAENERLQSELQHLKYQLQPHFFFNSLNNIYAMVDVSPEQSKEAIHSLSKLMRYFLYETDQKEVDLNNEITFMVNYIELMKLRFNQNVNVIYHFPQNAKEIKIAPLLFVSLIENAFKHGVSASESTTISFDMKVENHTVIFRSENKNFSKSTADRSGSGIGLENLKRRLTLLYKDRYTMDIEIGNKNYITTLAINL
ncbi:histidine kinase [Flavobacterium sediminis]|uniref:Histidine kinase n=1 Tax=Flavobacterium sediminis TaxID=2201181 RepID=A0A2U8QTI4_9FLAO|nr:histidine kinase [Flavobacterium sediminis]AWM13448.1 histidine kinase [Flavobacterium sediminis]